MGIKSLEVLLEPHLPVYLPGQTISGTVVLDVTDTPKCNGITVVCSGKAGVHFTKKVGRHTVQYHDNEKYFSSEQKLWIPEGKSSCLENGCKRIPFTYALPFECPSSFESKHGYIRYKVQANVDLAMARNKETKVHFSFNQLADLNFNPDARSPAHCSDEGTLTSCWCFKSGPMELQLHSPTSGEIAGGEIRVSGDLHNRDSKPLHHVTISLAQEINYITKRKQKFDQRILSSVSRPPTPAGGTDSWTNLALPIPAVAATLKYCNIMRMRHVVQVSCQFGSCNTNTVLGSFEYNVGTTSAAAKESFQLAGDTMAAVAENIPITPYVNLWSSPSGTFGTNTKLLTDRSEALVASRPCYFCTEHKVRCFRRSDFVPNYVCLRLAETCDETADADQGDKF